jgi:hypothetical protein
VTICFSIGGQEHCYEIPVVELPLHFPRPGSGPVNYPFLIQGLVLVASLHAVARGASDEGVREATQAGLEVAVQAMQSRAGDHVDIKGDPTASGPSPW